MRWVSMVVALLLGVLASSRACGQGAPRFDERYFNSTSGTTPPPAAWLPYYTRQLAFESERLLDDVSYELAGTAQGARVSARAQAVFTTAQRLDQAAKAGEGPGSATIRSLVRGVDAALGGMRSATSTAPGFAPQTTRTLARLERVAQDVRLLTGSYDNPYDFNPPPGADYRRLRRALLDLADSVGQLMDFVVTSGIDRRPGYGQLRYELGQLRHEVSEVQALVDRDAADRQIQRSFGDVRRHAGRIDAVVGGAGVSQPLQARWLQVQRNVERVRQILENENDPGPVPPGVFPPGPFPPGPPLPPIGGQVVAVIDQFNIELEQFMATLRPNVNSVPEGHQFLSDARNLQESLLQLRRQAGGGTSPGGVRRSLAEVESRYQRLWDRARRVAERPTGPNVQRLQRMGGYVQEIQGLLSR